MSNTTLQNTSQTDNAVNNETEFIVHHDSKKIKKILGAVYGVGMNVNNVIGSGIVTAPGIIWSLVKSPAVVLLLWLIGGIISMSGSLSYVELGIIDEHQKSGGEVLYLKTAYPKPKFMMSYIFSFIQIFAIRPGILCAILQSAAQYFWYTIKGHRYDLDMQQDRDGWHLPFSPFWVIKLLAVFLLFIITVYHMLSNRWANYINQTLAAIKLITYSTIAIAGIVKLISNWSISRINWQQSLSGNVDITAYSISILLIMFSYDGWNSVNYSLDELRNPEKNLVLSNSISVGIVTLIYLLVNIAFISVVPGEDILNGDKMDETIAATFFRQLFGGSEVGVRIFTGLVVLSVMGTAASTVWGGSRIIVAAARSDYFQEYSKKLKIWDDTPINALFAQFIWCSLIILFVGSSYTISGFTLFSTFSMYSYWIFYLFTGIGLLIIRRQQPQLVRQQQQRSRRFVKIFVEKMFKISPLIFILGGSYILIFSFFVDGDHRIQKLSPIFISYGVFFIALVLWYFLYYWWDTRKKQIENEIDFRLP